MAREVSFFQSRIPPLPYQLGLNRYSMDTEEEQRQLAGTYALEDIETDLSRIDDSTTSPPSSVDWEAAGASKHIINLVMTMTVIQRS